jgi:hypothetical protein
VSLFQTASPPLCRSVLAPPKSRRHCRVSCCDFRPFFSAAVIRVFCLSHFRPQAHRPVFGLRFPWLKFTAGCSLFSRRRCLAPPPSGVGFLRSLARVCFSRLSPEAPPFSRVSCRALGSAPPAGFQTFPPCARVLVPPRLTVRTHPVQTTSRSRVLDRSRNSEIPMALELRQGPCFC